MLETLKSNPEQTLAEFLEINFGSEIGITCLSSAPLLLQQCEADLKVIQSEVSIEGSIGKNLMAAIEKVSFRVLVHLCPHSLLHEHCNKFFYRSPRRRKLTDSASYC